MVKVQGFSSIRNVEVALKSNKRLEDHLRQIGCPCTTVPLEEGLENLGVSAMAVIHTNQVYRTHLEQIRDMRADESVPALVIVCLDDDAAVASFSRSDVGQIDRRIPEAKTRLVLSASKSKGPDVLRAELVVRGIDWQDDCADLSATAIEAIIAVENARRKKPPSQFKSRLQAPVSSSVDVSKAGASGDIVWIAMLQQIPGVGADMAAAIANRSCPVYMASTDPDFSASLEMSAELMNTHLKEADPKVYKLNRSWRTRLLKRLDFRSSISSSMRRSVSVLDAIGSVMTNKYSEGYPGARYYGGNEFIDQMENLCMERALETFRLDPAKWGVNVQTLSATVIRLTPKKVSMISKFFTSMPYRLDEKTGLIDYDELEKFAQRFRPKLLICGYSAYPRHFDFARLRAIADSVGGYTALRYGPRGWSSGGWGPPISLRKLICEHIRLMACGVDKSGNPVMYDFKDKINATVFPGLQGGPHNHIIAGLAVALKQAQTEEYKQYQQQALTTIWCFWICAVRASTAIKTEKVCDHAAISLNKNTVPGDKSAITPSGLRIGAPAMTTRGAKEEDFRKIAQFINRVVEIGLQVQKQSGPKLKDFLAILDNSPPPELAQLREEVTAFSRSFVPIGQ
ncbi:Serine hydroxymethyltransferase, cytosolic [Perkinsus olseni]|uniref:Serine hydroxymethyltransferase, cytosolic n=1 Tax=Perkinsus olseni TaxID=32597 RepID=A0A7J6PKK3_PEROL|nr:Serine hydroxymethyltransferase, cytosolic [Perkinsus olseni]